MRKFAVILISAMLFSACTMKIDIAQTKNVSFQDAARKAASGIARASTDRIDAKTLIVLPDESRTANSINDPGTGIVESYNLPAGKIMSVAMESIAPVYFSNFTIVHESDSRPPADLTIRMNFDSFNIQNATKGFSDCSTSVKTFINMDATDSSGNQLYSKQGTSDWHLGNRNCFSSQAFSDTLASVSTEAVADAYSDLFSMLDRTKYVHDYLASLKSPAVQQAPPADENLPAYRGDAYAVVIGIDYKSRSDIPNLTYSADDAKKVYSILTDKRYGGIDPENAVLLINSQATRSGIIAALRKLRTWKGYIYVYYSGHGAPITDGDIYKDAALIPVDAVIADTASLEETSVKLSYLQEMVDSSKAEGVMVALDACFTGGGKSIVAKGGKPLVGMMVGKDIIKTVGTGKIILTSSAGNQQSWEDDSELKSGIFSHYFEEGIKGAGTKNVWVNVRELASYVRENVAKAAMRLKGEEQQPQLIGKGDFAVSRNWSRFKVMDAELAKDKLRKAFEQGFISAGQLGRAVGELDGSSHSKLLDAFLDGSLDSKKFGILY